MSVAHDSVPSADPSGDPLAALGATRRAYVLPELKVLYISTAKNACTSVKWLVAQVAGEDLAGFRPGMTGYVNVAESIHRRSLWQRAKRLDEIEPALRAEISSDNGWFIFGITRDPRARLFSAWENKFLMHAPQERYRELADEPWYPRGTADAGAIIEDFAAFVDLIHQNPDHPVTNDAHFWPQHRLISPEHVSYTRIYDITELRELPGELEAHIRAQGWEGPELVLGRNNDTPLRANAAVFANGVKEKVEQFYARDFELWGDRWDYARIESHADWSPEALGMLPLLCELNERISTLYNIAVKARRNVKRRDARIAELSAPRGLFRRR